MTTKTDPDYRAFGAQVAGALEAYIDSDTDTDDGDLIHNLLRIAREAGVR